MKKTLFKRSGALLLFVIFILGTSVYADGFTLKFEKNQSSDKKILELGKDPGFNIRKLHKQGITGKGIGIAILDNYLLKDHVEYKNQLKKYIELGGTAEEGPELHGTATASIAVGKTIGVAPGADLYFLEDRSKADSNEFGICVYKAVKEVIKLNKELPIENRIRVISYSGMVPSIYPDYKSYKDALELAKKEGIFFVSVSMKHYGFYHSGLERKPESDPNNYLSFKPFPWDRYEFMDMYVEKRKISPKNEILFAPYDCRTTANQKNNKDYTFFKTGCPSWEVPYIAGLYVLACQVNPEITPELFWEKALETGYPVKLDKGYGEDVKGKIINPTKLYKTLKGLNGKHQ